MKDSPAPPSVSELLALVEQQAGLIAELQATVARQATLIVKLEARVAELEVELDETRRRGKRQATPFSKGPPKTPPKKPGRKTGHPAAQRPIPQRIDRTLEAPLPAQCPDCGDELVEDAVHVQYQEDIPRSVATIVTQFNVHVGHCAGCQLRIQGRHAEQTSDALGAAAVQLGPNALGLASELKHDLGAAYGKSARVLLRAFGLRVARSTLTRAEARLSRKLRPSYDALVLRLRGSTVVHVDETGWKIGGHPAWLWVFTNDELSVYVVDPSRAHEVVEQVLGADFSGTLVCDCFLAYEPLAYAQSKCVGHLIHRAAKLAESKTGRAVRFSQQIARLLRGAITLKARREQLSAHGYAVACGRLKAAFERLLDGNYTDPDNARLAKLLRKQYENGRLFGFLDNPVVDAVNSGLGWALSAF
jgi:transposase